jgi:hypothetical protein
VCAAELKDLGETIKSFGELSAEPVLFGNIISMECGHRLHRDCLSRWLLVAPEASCPMCRTLTAWRPSTGEHQNLSSILKRGYEIMTPREKSFLKWIWLAALLVSLTDQAGFYVFSFLILMLTPPPITPLVFSFLVGVRKFFVGGEVGERILIAVALASLSSILVVSTHVTNEP